jgi:hypothetical protein
MSAFGFACKAVQKLRLQLQAMYPDFCMHFGPSWCLNINFVRVSLAIPSYVFLSS